MKERIIRPRLLAVCNVDLMAWLLLKPWLIGLQEAGYEVHIACAAGEYFGQLAALGFHMHPISMQRTFRPWAHVRPLVELWKVMRAGQFSVINTHSAVAAAVGRVAARLANCRPVIYTVHGFLFHENMPVVPRSLLMAMEWILGRSTAGFMFVSAEDDRTAHQTGISPPTARTITIFNGVDLELFSPPANNTDASKILKNEFGIEENIPVVGIVGRIVREKGYREFLDMARHISQNRKLVFLVVGDTLRSDRDQFGEAFRSEVAASGIASSFLFTGQTNRVADYLRTMDIFVLPSYREGFPRSIVEAMGTGLPVVATDIRGCREAVVHGETGLIVPSKDATALARAIERLLKNPQEAAAMGRAGRKRAVHLYDQKIVQRNFVAFVNEVLRRHRPESAAVSREGHGAR